MTEPMHVLFDYLQENRIRKFLPENCLGTLLDERETALTSTFTETQAGLWDQWRETREDHDILYEYALFQAAFALGRELQ